MSIIKKYLKKDIYLYINFLDQQVKNDPRIYNKIRQFTIGQGDDYTTGCLLDNVYFKICYKMIAVDLSK